MKTMNYESEETSAGWSGFSLQWYSKLFQDTRVLRAFQNSLTVALIAELIRTRAQNKGQS